LDAFNFAGTMQYYDSYSDIISFEVSHAGTYSVFSDLLEAAKEKHLVKLYYQKFHTDTHDEYVLKPLALKEFGRRWYLVAALSESDGIRTFGLDRILKADILTTTFKAPDFDLSEYFKDYYGIMTNDELETEKIILSFTPNQGKYIKSPALHRSQEIISDTEEGLVISLNLKPTIDFIQKILSYGSSVTVISPEGLKNQMIETFKNGTDIYSASRTNSVNTKK
jgi:predicted DNA-binding transcriptional regulator YafY